MSVTRTQNVLMSVSRRLVADAPGLELINLEGEEEWGQGKGREGSYIPPPRLMRRINAMFLPGSFPN